jgi:hypothetical protein
MTGPSPASTRGSRADPAGRHHHHLAQRIPGLLQTSRISNRPTESRQPADQENPARRPRIQKLRQLPARPPAALRDHPGTIDSPHHYEVAYHVWLRRAGLPRCAPDRSRPSSRPMRCSCRCSTSRTWPRSPTRTTPGSGWCAAATRRSQRSAPANAKTCSPPATKPSWTRSPRPHAASADDCAARIRSRCGSVG